MRFEKLASNVSSVTSRVVRSMTSTVQWHRTRPLDPSLLMEPQGTFGANDVSGA